LDAKSIELQKVIVQKCWGSNRVRSHRNIPGKMIVVKHPLNTKASCLLRNPSNFSDTFDPQILAAFIRRGNQEFNSNRRTVRGAVRAEDQGAIQ